MLAKYCISPSLPPLPRPEGGGRIFCFSPSADVNKQHFPPLPLWTHLLVPGRDPSILHLRGRKSSQLTCDGRGEDGKQDSNIYTPFSCLKDAEEMEGKTTSVVVLVFWPGIHLSHEGEDKKTRSTQIQIYTFKHSSSFFWGEGKVGDGCPLLHNIGRQLPVPKRHSPLLPSARLTKSICPIILLCILLPPRRRRRRPPPTAFGDLIIELPTPPPPPPPR